MSGSAIQALERPVLIKNGTRTVGVIKPIRPRTAAETDVIAHRYEEWQKSWTDEDWQAMRKLLAERGIPEE